MPDDLFDFTPKQLTTLHETVKSLSSSGASADPVAEHSTRKRTTRR